MTHFLSPLTARGGAGSALVNARTGSVVAPVLESAVDSASRRRGLLGRDRFEADHALALAPCSAVHTCFMRFPIDIVFVSHDGRVLKIVHGRRPWRIAAAFGAFATIELPAGTLQKSDLAAGDRVVVRSAVAGTTRTPPSS